MKALKSILKFVYLRAVSLIFDDSKLIFSNLDTASIISYDF
jgi:hypothetical protein